MVEKGKELCEDLMANVKEQYEQFKSRPPRGFGSSSGGYGERPPGTNAFYGGTNARGEAYDPQTSAAGVTSPLSAYPPGTSSTPSAADYAAQYSQYYGTNDPYAAYGGYAAYATLVPGLTDMPC